MMCDLHFCVTGTTIRNAISTGLEPATSAVTGRRSNQLIYEILVEHLRIERNSKEDISPFLTTSQPCSVEQVGLEPTIAEL